MIWYCIAFGMLYNVAYVVKYLRSQRLHVLSRNNDSIVPIQDHPIHLSLTPSSTQSSS